MRKRQHPGASPARRSETQRARRPSPPAGTQEYSHELEAKKAESALQLLFKAARLTNEWALERLAKKHSALALPRGDGARSVPVLRESHTRLLPHIDLEGTRITTLAERLGISKQAVSELVDEMEQMGGLKRISDPQDGRAKLVCFTEEGRKWIFEGLEHLRSLECEMAEVLGLQQLDCFQDTCRQILAFLEAQASSTH